MKIETNKVIRPIDGIIRPKKRQDTIPENKTRTLTYSSLKLLGIIFAAVVLSVGISKTGSTISYYNDFEISIGNFLKADPLSFDVTVASSTIAQLDLSGGEVAVVPVMTLKDDSEPVQYFVKANFVSGDTNLCNAVMLTGTSPFPYVGNLLGLNTATSTAYGPWNLNLNLPSDTVSTTTTCTVDLVYKGWNADVPFGHGYSDTNKITLVINYTYVPKIIPTALFTTSNDTINNNSQVLGEATSTEPDATSTPPVSIPDGTTPPTITFEPTLVPPPDPVSLPDSTTTQDVTPTAETTLNIPDPTPLPTPAPDIPPEPAL